MHVLVTSRVLVRCGRRVRDEARASLCMGVCLVASDE